MKTLKTRKAGCLFSIIKIIAILVAIVFLTVYFFSGKIVDAAISTAGDMAGVKMSGKARISWTNFEFALTDFYIDNPDGFSTAKAISFKEALFRPDITLGGIEGSAPFIIDEIKIVGVTLLLEKNGLLLPSNLNEIKDKFMALIPQSEGGTQQPQQVQQSSNQSKTERKFIIRKLVFDNGTVSFSSRGELISQTLPSFTITNLGGENGSTAAVLIGEVLVDLINQAVSTTAKAALDVTQKEGTDAVNNISNSLKNLFN